MSVAPQINEDLFGTKTFTITFTIRDTFNQVDKVDAGYLETSDSGGATITGNGTHELTIIGVQNQCNTAMSNLQYLAPADSTENAGLRYYQENNADVITYTNFMLLLNRNSHEEISVTPAFVYNEDEILTMDIGGIADLRGSTLPDTQYQVDLTLSDPSAGVLTPSTITGTKSEVNALLKAVEFTPSADYTGTFDITYSQLQLTDSLDHGSAIINVNVGNTHDEFSLNNNFVYNEDEILTMDIGSITDLRPDNIDSNIQYQVDLTLSDPSAGVLTLSTKTGTKTEVNALLKAVEFIPSADYTGNFDITYSQQQTTDSLDQGSAIINVTVGNTHDEFSLNNNFVYNEDERIILDIGNITDLRPDNIDSNIQYQVDLTLSDLTVGVLVPSTMTGTKTEVNALLKAVEFTPGADYTGNFDITYSQLQLTDSLDHGSAVINVTFGVPHDEFSLNNNFVYNEDERIILDIGSITDLRPDNIDTSIQYRVSLLASDPTAGALTPNVLTGTKTEVNTLLKAVEFIPGADFTGSVDIEYIQRQTTDNIDQGNAFITLVADKTHDEFSINTSFIYNEDEILTMDIGNITDLRPDNIDSNIQYQVDLTLTDPNAGVLVPSTMTGTKTEVNALLKAVEFTPSADYTDNIDITYSQQQMTSNVNQGSKNIRVSFGAPHDEFIILPGETFTTPGNKILDVGRVTDLRPDNIDSNIQYQVDLTLTDPNAGVLTPSTITGTKSEVNRLLSEITYIPGVKSGVITIIYQQVQLDDNVNQGSAEYTFTVATSPIFGTGLSDYAQATGNGSVVSKSGLTGIAVNVSEVAFGNEHTLVLYDNGDVKAFGDNTYGQIEPLNVDKRIEKAVTIATGAKAIACGSHHSVILYNDGTVQALGRNNYAQVNPDGFTSDKELFTYVDEGVQAIACGDYHTLLLMENGDVKAYGRNGKGQASGKGVTGNTKPMDIIETGAKAIACGGFHTLILMENGDVKAFGDNTYSQCVITTKTDDASTSEVIETDVAKVSAGTYHTVLLMDDGDVTAFGYNVFGQVRGYGTEEDGTSTQIIETGAIDVAAGGNHTLILKNNGDVKAFGSNANGESRGDGDFSDASSSKVVTTNASSVYAGKSNSASIISNSLYVWGSNNLGQARGDGSYFNKYNTTPIESSILKCATGIDHTMLITTDNELRGFGRNVKGKISNSDFNSNIITTYEKSVYVASDIIDVASGNSHTGYVTASGDVYMYSNNTYWQVAQEEVRGASGSVITNLSWTYKEEKADVIAIACGAYHTVWLKPNGYVYAFGANAYNQSRGDGSVDERIGKGLVSLANNKAIVCGQWNTFLLEENGDLSAFGKNNYSQSRGDGILSPASTKQVIETNVAKVSAGNNHTLILMENGDVKAFGSNLYGESRGDGTTGNATVSKVIETGAIDVAAGEQHSLILMENGDVKAFGRNNYLQTTYTTEDTTVSRVIDSDSVNVFAGQNYSIILKE